MIPFARKFGFHSCLKFNAMLAILVSLGACQALKKAEPDASADQDMDKLLERAASNAQASGNTEKSLALLARVYQRNNNKPEAALRYARALRKTDQANMSADILDSFLERQDNVAELMRIRLHSELAMAHLSLGHFELGKQHAQRAIDTDEDADNGDIKSAAAKASHLLGIALDAQGQHERAENAFRTGLENWEGDPVPIMNNLALNLANQGHLDEAVKIIRKAKQTAPERKMVERNLRILTTMNEKVGYRIPPPSPAKKPEMGKPDIDKRDVGEADK